MFEGLANERPPQPRSPANPPHELNSHKTTRFIPADSQPSFPAPAGAPSSPLVTVMAPTTAKRSVKSHSDGQPAEPAVASCPIHLIRWRTSFSFALLSSVQSLFCRRSRDHQRWVWGVPALKDQVPSAVPTGLVSEKEQGVGAWSVVLIFCSFFRAVLGMLRVPGLKPFAGIFRTVGAPTDSP